MKAIKSEVVLLPSEHYRRVAGRAAGGKRRGCGEAGTAVKSAITLASENHHWNDDA